MRNKNNNLIVGFLLPRAQIQQWALLALLYMCVHALYSSLEAFSLGALPAA
jgi:hypothetical protein